MFVDTAGTERFHAMMPAFFHKADAFVIVYDITKRPSFQALTRWLDTIDNATNPETRGRKVMVIGNKSDLQDERAVSCDEGRQYAEKRQMGFFEISAKTGENFDDAMNYLMQKVNEPGPERSERTQLSSQAREMSTNQSGGCKC